MPTYTKTFRFLTLFAVVAGFFAAFAPTGARAEVASLEQALTEIAIGSPDAPVTMHEYSSLTCPHCANFHTQFLPDYKKEYVEAGKLRIVFHDFPLDNTALAATMIMRCSGPDRHFDFFDMLYQTQEDWTKSDNPHGSLVALARFYGLSGADVTTCLGNRELLDAIINARDTSSDLYGIKSTPSFVIDGKLIELHSSFDELRGHIDRALDAKGVK